MLDHPFLLGEGLLTELPSTFGERGDCFGANSAPRNDTWGEI